jgi:pimeloyl-ACP methyl ester carboxylesterase
VTFPARRLADRPRASWRESGAGPTAVIAAGLGLSSRFYEHSYDAFAAAGVRLVVPDLPGWGDTPGPLTGISPHQSAEFLQDFAAALTLPPAVWIGHSLGAQAVVELALQAPDQVRGLVLVGPTGRPGRLEVLRQAGAIAVETTRVSLDVVRGIVRDYLHTPPQRYLGTWLRHSRHDLHGQLRNVRCPVLVLVGDRDSVCTRGFIAKLEHCLPDARVVWVPGGTHGLPRGSAEEFNALTTAFVRELAARP